MIDTYITIPVDNVKNPFGYSAELQLNIYGLDGNTPSGMTDSSLFSSMSRPGHGPEYILDYDISESLVCSMTHIAALDHTYCISNPESELIGNTAYGCDISNVTTNENGSPLTMRVLPQFIGFDGISCMSALMATSFYGRYEGACTPSDLAVTRPYLMKLTIEEIKK